MTVGEPLLRKSALHRTHLKLGAKIQEKGGWLVPAAYRSADEEVRDAIGSVGVCDISHYGKISAKGNEVDPFLQGTVADLAPRRPGEARFSPAQGADKSSSQVQYVCRLTKEHALIVTRPLALSKSVLDAPSNLFQANQRVYLTNMTSVFAGLSILGPSSEAILSKLTQIRLRSASPDGPFCSEGGLAKINSLIAGRTLSGQGRELRAFDIYFGRDYAEYVWDAVMEAGSEFGLVPIGTDAHSRVLSESTTSGRTWGR